MHINNNYFIPPASYPFGTGDEVVRAWSWPLTSI